MLVAAGVAIVLATYFPIIFMLSNSLKTGASIFRGEVFSLFSQFDYHNYVEAAGGVARPLLNTVIVAVLSIIIGVGAAAMGGYAFAQLRFPGKSILFMAYIGLLMIPWTLTLIALYTTIVTLHLYNSWWALVLPYAAGSQPLLIIIFRSFFEQIPQELVASARIDGCSELGVLLRIIAPLTRPILLTGAVLMSIQIWGDYLWPTIALKNSMQYTISAGIQEYVNTLGYNITGGGSVFAAYVIATAPMFALIALTGKYFISGVTEGGLKM